MNNTVVKVTKRNGDIVDFDKTKIKAAILKAFISVDGDVSDYADTVANKIANYVESLNKDMSVEEIQDVVVNELMNYDRKDVSIAYIQYRYNHPAILG